jgi:hypothetical protein
MLSSIVFTSVLSTLAYSTPLKPISRRESAGDFTPSISPISIQNNQIVCHSQPNLPSNFAQLCINAAQEGQSDAGNTVIVPVNTQSLPTQDDQELVCNIVVNPDDLIQFSTDGASLMNIINQLVRTFVSNQLVNIHLANTRKAAATQEFPGQVCSATIIDSEGTVVGNAETQLASLATNTILSRRQTADSFIPSISINNNQVTFTSLPSLPSDFGQLCLAASRDAQSFPNALVQSDSTIPIPFGTEINSDASGNGFGCNIVIFPTTTTSLLVNGDDVKTILNQLVRTPILTALNSLIVC